jgi:hypothetical protein
VARAFVVSVMNHSINIFLDQLSKYNVLKKVPEPCRWMDGWMVGWLVGWLVS